MIYKTLVIGMMIAVVIPCVVFSQSVALTLVMPTMMYGPGSAFSVDLNVKNTGSEFIGAQVYVALSLGTGEFWFYPRWSKYPPEIDWKNVDVAGHFEETWNVIPEFLWPADAGEFSGAMLFAAITHNAELVSNVSELTFSWSEIPVQVSVGNMKLISAGSFTQGSPSTEPCRLSIETQFLHNLTRTISVMGTEVTRGMWADLKTHQPSLPADQSDTYYSPTMNHPVQQVTWFEAVLFANLLSVQNGYVRCYYTDAGFTVPITSGDYTTGPFYCDFDADGYRLPTEGEWEYFARAGTIGPFSCDESLYDSVRCPSCSAGTFPTLELYCVYCGINMGISAEAGSKLENPWGLKDVHGNVWEWCWDWAGTYPSGTANNYTGTESGSERIGRGGGFFDVAAACRSAVRAGNTPDGRGVTQGFRLVRTTGL